MSAVCDEAAEDSADEFELDMNYFLGKARLKRRGPKQQDWEDCGLGQFGLPHFDTENPRLAFYDVGKRLHERFFVFRDSGGNIVEKHSVLTTSGLIGTRGHCGLDEPEIQKAASSETHWCWTAMSNGQLCAFELHFEEPDAYEFWVQMGESAGGYNGVSTNGYTTLSQHSVMELCEARDGSWARLGKAIFWLVQNSHPYIARLEQRSSVRDARAEIIDGTRHETHHYLIRDAWIVSNLPSCDRSLRLAASCDVDGAVVAQLFQLKFDTSSDRICFEIALEMARVHNMTPGHNTTNWSALRETATKSLAKFREELNRKFSEAGIDKVVGNGRSWPHKRKPELSTEELARLQEPRYVR